MDVHFLGTTGYHPNQHQHTMCIMIPELGIVFDAGTGMFRVRDLIQTSELTVLLSHAHLDHVMGLTFLFDVLYDKPCSARVIGQQAKLAAIKEHLFSPLLFPVQPPYSETSLESLTDNQSWEIAKGVRCRWFPVTHPGGAVAYRLDFADGRSLAYVTDTTASAGSDYEQEIQNVDLLIHECYFPDGLEDKAELTGHSCLSPVIQLGHRVQAGKLALVHLNPLEQWAPKLDTVADQIGDLQVIVPDDQQVISF